VLLPVTELAGLRVPVHELLGLGLGLGLPLPVHELLGLGEPVPVTEPLGELVPVLEPLGLPLPVTEPLGEPVPVLEPLGLPLPVTEPLGEPVPVTEPLGLPLPVTEPLGLPLPVTEPLGEPLPVPELVEPLPVPELAEADGVVDGVAVGEPAGVAVGEPVEVAVGEPVGVADALGDSGVGDAAGDGEDDTDGLAEGDALSAEHSDAGLSEWPEGADETALGPGLVGAGVAVAAGVAVLPDPPCALPPTVDDGHVDVAVALGGAVAPGLAVPNPARPVGPPGEDLVPITVPWPSVWPPPGDCPPVSTFELTCTIAWRKVGTPSAMLAMNATPATTLASRSQWAPVGVAECRPAAGLVDRASELSRGRRSGHAQ
jgi:hypothetical protein